MRRHEIEQNKEISMLFKDVLNMSKSSHCYICSKKLVSHCNSHVVPRFILKEIADNGMIDYSQSIVKNASKIVRTRDGINNSHTFFMLCENCDNVFFKDYENDRWLFEFDKYSSSQQNKILSEIAIKSHLSHIFMKKNMFNLKISVYPRMKEFIEQNKEKSCDLADIKEHECYITELKRIRKKSKSCFNILYYRVLNYKIGIATQTIFAYLYDLEGNLQFNPNSPIIKLNRYFYLCAFPYKGKTIILFFIEKQNEKNVENIIKQFNNLTEGEKLHFLFISLIAFDEQFHISPSLGNLIRKDKKICKFFVETDGVSGERLKTKKIQYFKRYTNYFSKEYSIN